MAEVIRDWFGGGGSNLFSNPSTTNVPNAPNNTNVPDGYQQTPQLASSNFQGPSNPWAMPNTTAALQPVSAPNYGQTGGGQTTAGRGRSAAPNTVGGGIGPSTGNPASTWGISPVGAPSTGSTPGTQSNTPSAQAANPYGLPANPWNTNVTAGTVNPDLSPGPQTSFTNAGWNVNYPTEETAKSLGNMFGANVLGQNMTGDYGPAGAPSAPMYGLDFGVGDPQNVGQIAYWLQRGDSLPDIQARLAAGIAPPLGPGQGTRAFDWSAAPVQTFAGAPGNGSLNTGVNPSTHLGPIGGPTTNLQPGAVSGAGTVYVPPTGSTPPGTTPGTAPTGPPAGPSSGVNWADWQAFMNSNYFPLAEPGANEQAINANITPQMMSNPALAAYLGITPATPNTTNGGNTSGGGTQEDSMASLLRLFGLMGGGGQSQQNQNPFWQTFLQSLQLTPQMYLR